MHSLSDFRSVLVFHFQLIMLVFHFQLIIFIILYLVIFLFYMNYLYTQNKFEWDRANNTVVRRVWENHAATR
jgi:c-di-AMP phosphodiesterase-like protein